LYFFADKLKGKTLEKKRGAMAVTEAIYQDEREIFKHFSIFCSNKAKVFLRDRNVEFEATFKECKNGEVFLSSVVNANGLSLENYRMRPLDAEVSFGSDTFLFVAYPTSANSFSLPDVLRSHPKRRYPRITVIGNPYISKMYTIVTVRVVDPSIEDNELAQKIHLILSTIESNLVRSENYSMAKVTLYDGSEKSVIVQMLREYKRPFVVFNTGNLTIKDENFLSYENYVKFMMEKGASRDAIMAQLDKIKDFYVKNAIKSEIIVPLIFEEEVIGQIRVVTQKDYINKSHVIRLNSLAVNAIDNLFTKCAFEVVAKEPQPVIDLGVMGIKILVTDPDLYRYIRLGRRVYVQLYFPDDTVIKTMATIVNVYDPTPEGHQPIGVKLSSNLDWKDKRKLEEFIQSVIRLEKTQPS